jgi:hypothetical protein
MDARDEIHKGFRLWPSKVPNSHRWEVRIGPVVLMLPPWPDPFDLPTGETLEAALAAARLSAHRLLKSLFPTLRMDNSSQV